MRKHCSWTVTGNFWIEETSHMNGKNYTSQGNFITKPTIKSAFRLAKKLANQYNVEIEIYNNQDNKKAYRRGKQLKVFIVSPTNK